MSVAKTIELSAISPTSFEDAIREAITKSGESLRNIQGAWVKEQKVVIENGEIAGFQAIITLTFVVE
ncbi:MAG TPA: dodecin family protein [Miltoncostaeaceae bacterium]|nr:dodecin family protein [Miltoncostaeaceae bacterium]